MDKLTFLESASINIILPVAAVLAFVIYLNLQNKYGRESHLNLIDKHHSWQISTLFTKSYCCSGCEVLLVNNGFVCDTCGLSTECACLKKVSNIFKCKEVSTNSQQPFKHRWILGNFPIGCSCEICSKDFSDELKWKRCIWCHRRIHLRCQSNLNEICDFGRFRQFIIPPTHVQIIEKKTSVLKGYKLKSISDPNISGWRPVFVIANRSSGSQAADEVLRRFRSFFNPLQTAELSTPTLERLVFILTLLPQYCKPIILIAGGDGSVASTLSILYKNHKNIQCEFSVGIVPLGTGNDLSRALGWGKEEPNPFSAHDMLNRLLAATPLSMDRWEVNITRDRRLALPRQVNVRYMYNYISIGVDARVTLDFHRARSSPWYLVGGRFINKALYLAFGTQQVMDRECSGLEKKIDIELDGLAIDLPALEAVVILNISSWGAGCNLWELKEADEEIALQSLNDGILEIVGIYSSFHMAQMQVGLSTPYRIGQASTVKIVLKSKEAMQIDGEPWMQSPCSIEVKSGGQVAVLKAPPLREEAGDEAVNNE